MRIIPVGYGVATFEFSVAGVSKGITWSIGYKPETPGLADPSPNAATIRDCFSASGGPYDGGSMSSLWNFRGVNNVEMTGSGLVVGASFVGEQGTLSSQSVPVNSAMLMTKFTARGGRRGRGRAYLPCCTLFSEADVTVAGIIDAGSLSIVVGMYVGAINQMTTLGVPAYLLHSETIDPATGLVDPTADPPPAPDLITSIAINSLLATQRRRMR